MADAAMLTGIRMAIVDVELTVLPLETFGALTGIEAHMVSACRSVLTRRRITLVDLLLTIAARIAFRAVTPMAVAHIFAGAIMAKLIFRD